MSVEPAEMTPDLADRLAELRAAEAAATPGPWTVEYEVEYDEVAPTQFEYVTALNGPKSPYASAPDHPSATHITEIAELSNADARLIAAMRNALPELLAAVERVTKIHYPSPHKRAVETNGILHWVEICVECQKQHPCPTIRALEGATDAD